MAETTDQALVEAQRVERAIARVRWGGVGLALLLGPQFPNLSLDAVLALGISIAGYNLVTVRASSRARSLESHARVAQLAFAADLAALSVAMLLFSNDPLWTTFMIGPLVIVGATFRFGRPGTLAATGVLGSAYVGVVAFRVAAFGYPADLPRVAFHLAVYVLTAVLVERLQRDVATVRRQREELIQGLERRVAEDAAIAQATRIVAGVPLSDEIVPALLRASRAVFRFDRATVFVADEGAGEYRPLHRLVETSDVAAPPAPRIAVGTGLLGAALAADRPLLVPNVLEDPRYEPRAGDQARSVILVPLRVGGRPIATLSLSRALPDMFVAEDLRLAETVASLVAQVLENRRLFNEASAAEALRAMDRLKDEFLAMVSHELRTPIQVIRSALELLASNRTQNRERLVEQATRGLQRLSRTVEDVLDLAQLQETGIELTRELVQPESLLAEVAAAHELMAAEHGHVLRVGDDGEAPAVLVDRRRMSQVLGNLVANALRYSSPRSNVRLSATLHGDEVRFAVSDEGPGIPESERERVFDKFYRLRATRQMAGGSGLGLAIAKSLVELHGGRIWVEDALDGGSAFVVAVHAERAGVPAGPH
ncbi:MAG: GAF domain-containing sensor histidine kinase [Candidatus Limnocylindria bacterium]